LGSRHTICIKRANKGDAVTNASTLAAQTHRTIELSLYSRTRVRLADSEGVHARQCPKPLTCVARRCAVYRGVHTSFKWNVVFISQLLCHMVRWKSSCIIQQLQNASGHLQAAAH